MSILSTGGSLAAAQTQDLESGTLIFLGWALVGAFVAKLLGAFRRRSIVGPQRIGQDETAWSLVLVFSIGAFAALTLTGFAGRFIHADETSKLLITNVMLEGLAFLGIVGATYFLRPRGIEQLGLLPIQIPRGIALGATTLFIVFPVVTLIGILTLWVMRHMGLPEPDAHQVLRALKENHGRAYETVLVVLAVIGAPFAEELAFRGFMQTILSRFFHWLGIRGKLPQPGHCAHCGYDMRATPDRCPECGTAASPQPADVESLTSPGGRARWLAVLITSVLFAAVHGEVAFFPPLFVLAVALGYLYERSGNLWATIFMHALFNSVQILLFLSAPS